MKTALRANDLNLLRRFYITELAANLLGAPLVAAYGAFMIDFRHFDSQTFVLNLLIVMCCNLAILAIPCDLLLGRYVQRRLESWRSGDGSDEKTVSLYSFITQLPMIQTLLVFLRTVLCSFVILLIIRSEFDTANHLVATLTFAVYAAFFCGVCIYYFFYAPCSKVAEELIDEISARGALGRVKSRRGLFSVYSTLTTILPTIITSLGILLLVLVIGNHPERVDAFVFRIGFALILNIATNVVILLLGKRFHNRRLNSIVDALEMMLERGDTSRPIPTDLSDDFAWAAHYTNQTIGLFKQILAKVESASRRLSGTVMNFSSQIRETVAAATQQASSVKEVVGTMETVDSHAVDIDSGAADLLSNAQESQALVDAGFGKIQDTIKKMDEIKGANVQTQSEIVDLTEQISSIGEVIDIINNIANQTRIIAFNAELEASSAGDAGTSFRIVAEEIRRLASNTVEALVNIKTRIGEIQKSSKSLQSSAEEGTNKIEDGMKLSADLNDIFMRIRISADQTAVSAEGISSALGQTTQANEIVFTTLKQIAEGAEQVMNATHQSSSEVNQTQSLIGEFQSILEKFSVATGRSSEASVVLNFGKQSAE
jgi:methyl-accepting chemotaxis protein